jgi:hypothetical protein
MDRSTIIRNVYVAFLFLAATLSVMSIQLAQNGSEGDTLLIWFIYILAAVSAIAVLLYKRRT